MLPKKKHSNKERTGNLARVLSDPDIKHSKKRPARGTLPGSESLSPEPVELLGTKPFIPARKSYILNLQIPKSSSTKRPKKSATLQRPLPSPKARPSHEGDEKTTDLTKVKREKNNLLAKVTALQQEIYAIKNENKRLKANAGKANKLEGMLKAAYYENSLLKGQMRPENSWSELEKSMELFKSALATFLA